MISYDNTIEIILKSGKTGEIISQYEDHNDISDDILCHSKRIMINYDTSSIHCMLLPDGPKWNGFTWNRKNPWAPYCFTKNRIDDPYISEPFPGADKQYAICRYDGIVNGKQKLFFQWTKLPDDFILKAIGIMNWSGLGLIDGVLDSATAMIPDTLLILPSPITIKGRKLGVQTPDILEITYYLSTVGVQ